MWQVLLSTILALDCTRVDLPNIDSTGDDFALNVRAEAEYVKECLSDGESRDTYDDSWYNDALFGSDAWITKLMQMNREDCRQLRQSDFQLPADALTIEETGKPQCFILMEDVEVDFGRVDKLRRTDSETPLHHGFVFAIRILAENVLIDLQGHSIQMSRSYFNRAPFVSIIDLTEFPLDGKSMYPKIEKWANRTVIHNGTIGLSSHFGIHGNYNDKLLLSHLRIENFAIAGVQLNGATDLSIEHVVVDNSGFRMETDVSFGFVLEMKRRAQWFVKDRANGYVNVCPNTNANEDYSEIRAYIGREIESILVDADFERILDDPSRYMPANKTETAGNIYGIYLASEHNVKDFATAKRDETKRKSANIRLIDVVVKNIAKSSDEGRTICFEGAAPVNANPGTSRLLFDWKDSFGHRGDYSMLCDENGRFRRNDFRMKLQVIRILLTDCSVSEEDFKGEKAKLREKYAIFFRTVLPRLMQGGFQEGAECREAGFRPLSSLDTSGHLSKGLVGVRMDQIYNLLLHSVRVENLHDKSTFGIKTVLGEKSYVTNPPVWKTKAHSTYLYKGNFVYGITLSGCNGVKIESAEIRALKSDKGSVMGVAMMGANAMVCLNMVDVRYLMEGMTVTAEERAALRTPNLVSIAVPYFVDRTAQNGSAQHDISFSSVRPNVAFGFSGKDCDETNETSCSVLPAITIPSFERGCQSLHPTTECLSSRSSGMLWIFAASAAFFLFVTIIIAVSCCWLLKPHESVREKAKSRLQQQIARQKRKSSYASGATHATRLRRGDNRRGKLQRDSRHRGSNQPRKPSGDPATKTRQVGGDYHRGSNQPFSPTGAPAARTRQIPNYYGPNR